MFRTKICGVTRSADMEAIVASGADAIGLNFVPTSSRYLASDATLLPHEIPTKILRVGVFADQGLSEVAAIVEKWDIDIIQLHGHENVQFTANLRDACTRDVETVKAVRLSDSNLPKIRAWFVEAAERNALPDAVLVDAAVGALGGSGERADWTMIVEERSIFHEVPLILAGGLTPNNVSEAITTVSPFGVDVASGVESSPGKKDGQLVCEFVERARIALGI